MKWRPTITPEELDDYSGFLPQLRTAAIRRLLVVVLQRLSNFIGLPIILGIPEDIVEFKGDYENLRALRILNSLREMKIVDSFKERKQQFSDEPLGKTTFVHLHGIDRLGFVGRGSHINSRAKTLWPALGEAIERFSLQHFKVTPAETVTSSWNELQDEKINIFDIAGFTDEKRKEAHPLFNLALSSDSKLTWVQTTSLPNQKTVWAPLQLFSFDHLAEKAMFKKAEEKTEVEPLIRAPISTGAAAGQTLVDALLAGTLEIIERDAFIIYWLNQLVARKVDLNSFKEERFKTLLQTAREYNLELHALYLKTDMPVHTVCSVVIDRTGVGPAVLVGARTGFDLGDTVYQSFAETLTNRDSLRGFMEGHRDELSKGSKNIYQMGHKGRMLHWFQYDCIKDIEHFISGDNLSFEAFPTYKHEKENKKDLDTLITFIRTLGYTMVYRDISLPKLKKVTEGVVVVVVLIPEMQPLYLEESLMETYGERLTAIPKMLGNANPLVLSKIPHPFP
jgi:ribosomal protein S12 methylthiotransferase accessory factor